MTIHYFEAYLDNYEQLKQFENGNIRMYSLHKSFNESVIWEIRGKANPEDYTLYGEIKKLLIGEKEHKVLTSEWKEAKSALKGAFTKIRNENKIPRDQAAAPKFRLNLTDDAKGSIAFTLSGFGVGQNSHKNDYLHTEEFLFEFTTWKDKQTETNRDYVHGLVLKIAGGRFLDLIEYAQILGKKFGKDQLTWLQFCTNTEAWEQSNQS